ncbi:hypothetical protein L9F63_023579, partial [Diploptera punctata]
STSLSFPWRAVGQQQQGQSQGQQQQQQQQQGTPPVTTSTGTAGSSQQVVPPSPAGTPPPSAPPACSSGSQHTPVVSYTNHQGAGVSLERSISAPASSHHSVVNRPPLQQQHGDHPPRPPLGRSMSRTEVVKKYIKRETAVFFGVEESKEEDQRKRWLDRRKRLASRKYGSLREEYMTPTRRLQPPPDRMSAPTRDTFASGRPDVLPGGRESLESTGGPQASTPPRWAEPPVRRKESVARMTFGGLALVVAIFKSVRPRGDKTMVCANATMIANTSNSANAAGPNHNHRGSSPVNVVDGKALPTPSDGTDELQDVSYLHDIVVLLLHDIGRDHRRKAGSGPEVIRHPLLRPVPAHHRPVKTRYGSWRRTPLEMSDSGPEVGCSRIWSRVLDRVFDNSNRRQYGMGVVGRFFGRSMKRSVTDRAAVKEQLDDIEDHRPFFTYWVRRYKSSFLSYHLRAMDWGLLALTSTIGLDRRERIAFEKLSEVVDEILCDSDCSELLWNEDSDDEIIYSDNVTVHATDGRNIR